MSSWNGVSFGFHFSAVAMSGNLEILLFESPDPLVRGMQYLCQLGVVPFA